MPSPTLAATLAAYAGITGAHLAGHYDAANKEGVPISTNVRALTESWNVPNDRQPGDYEAAIKKNPSLANLFMTDKEYADMNNRKRANIHGGGFDMQGKITQLVSDAYPDQDVAKSVRMAEAIHEALYASGAFEKGAKDMIQGGDFGGMEKTSGNKQTRAIVALDAIKNFIMATNGKKETNWDVRPTVIDGAPGAMFSTRF